MKTHKYLFLLISWNPQPAAEGFKLFWRQVSTHLDCYHSTRKDFIKYKDTKKPEAKLSLKDGEIYEIRALAYSGSYETDLSEERICIKIDSEVKQEPKWEKPQSTPIPTPIVSITETIKIDTPQVKEEPIEAPPVENITVNELEEDEYEEDIISTNNTIAEPEPWSDIDTGLGPYETTAGFDGIQPVLEREKPIELPKQNGFTGRRFENTNSQRIHLFKESDIGPIRNGQGILRSSYSVPNGERSDSRVSVLKRGMRNGESNTSGPSDWSKGRIITVLSVVLATILGLVLLWYSGKFTGEE